jgi:hypothetical protein
MGMIVNPYQVGAAWSPLDLPDLVAWYDASFGVYSDAGSTPIADTEEVVQWNDRSGNGYHLSRDVTGPTYNADGLNGLPTMHYVANSALKTVTNAVQTSGSNVVSCFAVLQLNSASLSFARLVTFLADGQTTDYDNDFSVVPILRDNSNATLGGYFGAAKANQNISYDTSYRFGTVADGTNMTSYLNLSATSATAMNGTLDMGGPTNNQGTFYLGRSAHEDAGSDRFRGMISEVVICLSDIGSDDRTALDAYLVSKWGF